MDSRETLLAELPGSDELHRVIVVHRADRTGTQIEMRQQSWGEGVGWFTQSSIALDPHQFSQLRQLGGLVPQRRAAALPRTSTLRVLRAESA